MPDEASEATGGYIDLRDSEDGQFYYCICSEANHAVLATSETYPTRDHLKRAVTTFQGILSVHLVVRDSTEADHE